jgi:hypothetical protein
MSVTQISGGKARKGDVYDFMLLFNPYIEIFLQEIKNFHRKA